MEEKRKITGKKKKAKNQEILLGERGK